MGFHAPARCSRVVVVSLGAIAAVTLYLEVVTVSMQTRNQLAEGRLRDEGLGVLKVHVVGSDSREDGLVLFRCPPRSVQSAADGSRSKHPAPPDQPAALMEWVLAANEHPVVLNEDMFGRLQDAPSARHIIVVQVHRRSQYLRWLLRSLSHVVGIESALLVLSFDHVEQELLSLASEVCFCRVLRVFFPFSMQLWPDQFPGDECSNGTTSKQCPRDARATMAKHHWWWLHNFVFNEIYTLAKLSETSSGRPGMVLFLEEDMYLSPDALSVLDMMQDTRPDADLIVLGDNKENLSKFNSAKALFSHWVYNMGLAMGLPTWSKIARCAKMFCEYNDYNWDWTMQAVGARCIPGHFKTLVMKGSRLFHIGKCGGMHSRNTSDCESLVRAARRTLDQAMEAGLLFPEALHVDAVLNKVTVGRPNGGFLDPRDHQLCMDNANASVIRFGGAGSGTAAWRGVARRGAA